MSPDVRNVSRASDEIKKRQKQCLEKERIRRKSTATGESWFIAAEVLSAETNMIWPSVILGQ